MAKIDVCQKILNQRLRRKMSRKELGKRAGVSEQAIIKIESMETLDPKSSTIFRICRVLEINILWVYDQFAGNIRSM